MKTITTNIFYVYKHTWENTNYIYIGKGKKDRYKTTSKRNVFWKNITAKYGTPLMEIITDSLAENEAFDIEIKTIKSLENTDFILVNLTNGGEGISGYSHTEETKKKIGMFLKTRPVSEKQREVARQRMIKNNGDYRRGVTHTEETKKKMSLNNAMNNPDFKKKARKNRIYEKVSLETREKMSLSGKNRLRTAEYEEKRIKAVRDSNSGINNFNYDKNIYTFKNDSLNIIERCTQYELRHKYSIKSGKLGCVCKGQRKSTEGWIVL